MIKRLFDLTSALVALIIFLPVFIIISIVIIIDSGFPVFYRQIRVGKDKREFKIFKFRTMINNASRQGLLTIGKRDSRITNTGHFLRKSKLDELPQLFNVIIGDMSIVGPRPETPNYVKLYNPEQTAVLSVRPGLTDYASLEYLNENEILGSYSDPEQAYISIIMPAKLNLNLKYIREQSFVNDLMIIFKTLTGIISKKNEKN